MSLEYPLAKLSVAVSISESADLEILGLHRLHLEDAMIEIARHLLALGARVIYGGDFRNNGFTEQLCELAVRHHTNNPEVAQSAKIANYIAWPVHASSHRPWWDFNGSGDCRPIEIIYLTVDGQRTEFPVWNRTSDTTVDPSFEAWRRGLTALRKTMLSESNVRIVLGGQVEKYKGVMPGIAEEALLSLDAKQPLFLLGGFGGCTRDIAETMGLVKPWSSRTREWEGRNSFVQYRSSGLMNSLSVEENQILAKTPHIDEAIPLVLKGIKASTTGNQQ